MPRTKTFTDEEMKYRRSQNTQKTLANNYKQLRVNVKKPVYYVWNEYAKSKGMSLFAMVHKFFEDAIAADNFTPDVPYDESEK